MSEEQKLELKLELRLKQLASVEAEMFDELVEKTVLLGIKGGDQNFAYGTLAAHGTNFIKMTDTTEGLREDYIDRHLTGKSSVGSLDVRKYPSKMYNKSSITSVREKTLSK